MIITTSVPSEKIKEFEGEFKFSHNEVEILGEDERRTNVTINIKHIFHKYELKDLMDILWKYSAK